MIHGAQLDVRTGRLVFVFGCVDCRQVFVRDDEYVRQTSASGRPIRCEPCEALHRSSMAGAFEEVGDAAAELWAALLAPLAALLDKIRPGRGR